MNTVKEIYEKYNVPTNIQEHMIRVTGIALEILDNWAGPSLNRNLITRVLLLHDIGNIVKSDFPVPDSTNVVSKTDIESLRTRKSIFIEKYGEDDHKASMMIAIELGLNEKEIDLMNSKIFINNDQTLLSPDYNIKVAAYADQRVAPTGVMSLIDRLLEAKERYKNKPGSSMNNSRTQMLIDCAIEIENQLKPFLLIKPEEISEKSIKKYTKDILKFKI